LAFLGPLRPDAAAIGAAAGPRALAPPRLAPVSAEEVDRYLRGLEEPKRSTLQTLRRTILEIVPRAEQVISYRVPAFRVGGKTVAGFAARRSRIPRYARSASAVIALNV